MRWMFLPMIAPVLNNMDEAEDFLKNDPAAKDVKWTTVLPAGLTNKPVSGRIFSRYRCLVKNG